MGMLRKSFCALLPIYSKDSDQTGRMPTLFMAESSPGVGLAMLSRAHIIYIGDYFYIYLTCLAFSGPIEFSGPMEQGAPSCNNTGITSSFQIN